MFTRLAARAVGVRAPGAVGARAPALGAARSLSASGNLGSVDYGWTKDRIEKGGASNSAENRGFTYLVMGSNKFIYASAVRIGALKFIATMSRARAPGESTG